MFSLTACDPIMLAHSVRGAQCAPAQLLLVATCAVNAGFRATEPDSAQPLVDIGPAADEGPTA